LQEIGGEEEEDDEDDDDEEEGDLANAVIVDEDMIYEGNNHNTFRPVSILESGLDLNENELNYDMNRNFGGTMNGTFYDADGD
jgi:hypothetical protein